MFGTQANPSYQLETPDGCGWVKWVWWNDIEQSIYYTVHLDIGRIGTYRNELVRACQNFTVARPNPEKPNSELGIFNEKG